MKALLLIAFYAAAANRGGVQSVPRLGAPLSPSSFAVSINAARANAPGAVDELRAQAGELAASIPELPPAAAGSTTQLLETMVRLDLLAAAQQNVPGTLSAEEAQRVAALRADGENRLRNRGLLSALERHREEARQAFPVLQDSAVPPGPATGEAAIAAAWAAVYADPMKEYYLKEYGLGGRDVPVSGVYALLGRAGRAPQAGDTTQGLAAVVKEAAAKAGPAFVTEAVEAALDLGTGSERFKTAFRAAQAAGALSGVAALRNASVGLAMLHYASPAEMRAAAARVRDADQPAPARLLQLLGLPVGAKATAISLTGVSVPHSNGVKEIRSLTGGVVVITQYPAGLGYDFSKSVTSRDGGRTWTDIHGGKASALSN